MARVDKHDNAVGPIGSLNDWNESECFDAVVITLAGYDVRLTYGPNIVRRRADQLTDATLALAITKPGGLTAVIASHSLMDSPADHGRRDLAALADLVGAVRFPAGIYRPATGTDEVVDLLLFRRRESGAPRRGHDFEAVVESRLDGGSVTINTYFDTNVDQVLGSTQYDPTGARPTNLTVVGSRTLFPGVLTTALNDVIAFAQRAGLTTGPRQRQRPGAPLPMRARRLPGPHRQAGPGLDGP
ncbi:hypothetical protein [Cellulosimicrobium sp. SJTW-1]|uniref:hypothetical protein n=1 Tax=Cellulosimicrobium sp. SJTW-1 TaxID=3078082 RepID=UPI0039E80492